MRYAVEILKPANSKNNVGLFVNQVQIAVLILLIAAKDSAKQKNVDAIMIIPAKVLFQMGTLKYVVVIQTRVGPQRIVFVRYRTSVPWDILVAIISVRKKSVIVKMMLIASLDLLGLMIGVAMASVKASGNVSKLPLNDQFLLLLQKRQIFILKSYFPF